MAGKQNKILNIGAATCRTSELLEQFGEVTSLEYDKECCEFVTRELKRPIVNGSILELPFSNESFDLVCSFDVIEHVSDDELAISEMLRVCRPGGMLSITVPAYNILRSYHDVVNHHYRRYTLNKLKGLFKDKKGTVIYKSYFNTILFIPISVFRLASKILPQRWIRRGAGTDNTIFKKESSIHKLFHYLFSLEKPLLNKMRFPFGISILLQFRKD
jgi:SAM-dependent methyltransferase